MRSFHVGLGLALSIASLGTGCAASQNWTTARTLDPGQIQHTVGVEVLGINLDDEDESVCTELDEDGNCTDTDNIGFVGIPFPAYGLRIGVAEDMEVGLKASTAATFSADFKWQLVRSEAFDLALDPTVGTAFLVSFVQLPVILSFNFGEMVTLTVSPKGGVMLPHGSGDESYSGGVLFGGGANVQIRITDRFALTPGLDVQRLAAWTDGEAALTLFSAGLGFSFGRFPSYGATPAAAL